MLKRKIWTSLMVTTVAAAISCGSRQPPAARQADLPAHTSAADSGLASAANRKAIIAELGKSYQKSASGRYRKRVASIAPFSIELVSGKRYTYQSLARNQAVTLVYFSPGCQECQAFTEALTKLLPGLKDRQFVFITYEPLDSVKAFYQKNRLNRYPQIKMGTEGYQFTVQKYYEVQHFPFAASYDSQGHLIRIYANSTDPEQLAAGLAN